MEDSGMGKKVGVVLSGCGVQDGSEIQEAVLLLLALDQAGADVVNNGPGYFSKTCYEPSLWRAYGWRQKCCN